MLLGGDCETNYVSGWQRQNSTELQQTAEVTAGPWTLRFIKRGETCCKNLELLTSFAELSKRKPFFFLLLLDFFWEEAILVLQTVKLKLP